MKKENIAEKVITIITDVTGIDAEEVTLESEMMDDLSMSSLEIRTMISEIEDAYDLSISSKDMRSFIVVNDIVDYVKEEIIKK